MQLVAEEHAHGLDDQSSPKKLKRKRNTNAQHLFTDILINDYLCTIYFLVIISVTYSCQLIWVIAAGLFKFLARG